MIPFDCVSLSGPNPAAGQHEIITPNQLAQSDVTIDTSLKETGEKEYVELHDQIYSTDAMSRKVREIGSGDAPRQPSTNETVTGFVIVFVIMAVTILSTFLLTRDFGSRGDMTCSARCMANITNTTWNDDDLRVEDMFSYQVFDSRSMNTMIAEQQLRLELKKVNYETIKMELEIAKIEKEKRELFGVHQYRFKECMNRFRLKTEEVKEKPSKQGRTVKKEW